MKTAIFAATVFSIILCVLATPATHGSGATSIAAPVGFQPPDVNSSVGESESDSDIALTETDAASTQYWVCIAVSTSTLRYGWARGGSESSALKSAKRECGRNDCNSYSCVDMGCVGIDYGSRSVSLSYASGYGKGDGAKAASKALSNCKSYDHGCGKPGYFCAARII